jgi:hypothetical protein
MKFLRDRKVSSPHPEERPAGPRLEGWVRTLPAADASRRPLRGLLSMRWLLAVEASA